MGECDGGSQLYDGGGERGVLQGKGGSGELQQS